MTYQELSEELGRPQRPTRVWQEPFDRNPKHYRRLCECQVESRFPELGDLCDYLEDLKYQKEIQFDLLLFLLPVLLRAWSMHLLRVAPDLGGYAQEFWLPWTRRKTNLLESMSETQRTAFERYVREAIITAIDRGRRLKSVGSMAYCGRWFDELGSFATVFSGLSQLWKEWWTLTTEGRAIGALQYLDV
jgi:hypothetical protein